MSQNPNREIEARFLEIVEDAVWDSKVKNKAEALQYLKESVNK